MSDKFVIDYCGCIINGKYVPRQSWKTLLSKEKYDIISYLKTRFADITENDTVAEIIYRIINNISVKPVCKVCNKPTYVNRFSQGFLKYCSNDCKHSSIGKKLIGETVKNTVISKYNVSDVMLIPDVKYKAINNSKQTLLEKYGVDHNFKIHTIRQKIKETTKSTYGYEYAFLDRDKVISTLHKKYGYDIDNVSQLEFVKQSIINSKRNNNSFTTSNPEELTYNILLNVFPDIVRQYKSEQYPFNCDFYIPSVDTYIELQGNWTHGTHPFDENDIDDINTYNKWIDKSSKNAYYKNAAINWRYTDTKKRQIAKENNIILYEIFYKNKKDLINKLTNLITELIPNSEQTKNKNT